MYKPNMEDKRLKITIENKSDVMLHGLKPGAKKQIEADCNGMPLEKHWRRRLRDSIVDGAIVVEKETKVYKSKKEVKD